MSEAPQIISALLGGGLEARQYAADRVRALADFAEWVVSLDDPEDVLAREERRTVTMSQIIDRAKRALDA